MYCKIFIFILIALAEVTLAFSKDTGKFVRIDPVKSVVWKARENNAEGYRIPGIVVTSRGITLAFAEERLVYGDADPKSLVVKRSKDGGKTWSENIYIEKCNGTFWKENQDLIYCSDEQNKKEVWTNVAPIVDYEAGKIFFFYALNEGKVAGKNLQRYTRVFYRVSEDDGATWSERKEVTDLLNATEDGTPNKNENNKWTTDDNGFPCDFLGRAFHMPGPGHGIQLSDGRLLLQIWNRTALARSDGAQIPVPERLYGLCTIFSDDHGKTWNYGSAFGHGEFNMNEARMAELSNGEVYLNARYVDTSLGNKNNYRLIASSRDGGEHWSEIKVDYSFVKSNPCDAGLLAVPSGKYREKILVYSKNESEEGRKNLVVRLSFDEGKSWPVVKQIDKGPALYSDLALLPDKSVLLIYETGKNAPVYCVRMVLKLRKNNALIDGFQKNDVDTCDQESE
ncbi:sialidase family protein [Maribellus sediminis]|uniref:sialidase family protein n=1 Tax=Maribellus sediminis TaxID=2696285 RepID=UPI00143168E9|nr:sialidase family protein [Maribellus sediminis]